MTREFKIKAEAFKRMTKIEFILAGTEILMIIMTWKIK